MFTIPRSEIQTLVECPERAYATYREDGTGYTPTGTVTNITTLQGSALHKGGEVLFNGGVTAPWREAVAQTLLSLPEPHRTIRTTLIRRALLGWSLARYPQIISEYQPLGAEIPFTWEFAPGFRQPLRLDDILEHRTTASLAIFDFKTAGSPDLNWTERKKNSKQTHLYVKALKEVAKDLHKHVGGIIYDCIEIGKWDNKKSIMKSPFVTGYKKGKIISPKSSYGATVEDLTVWSDDRWLQWAKETKALEGLYWTTGLLTPNESQLERTHLATIETVKNYEVKLNIVKNSLNPRAEANIQFDRNPEECLKFGWDYACPFYGRCWKGEKLDFETFEPRKNHHEPES